MTREDAYTGIDLPPRRRRRDPAAFIRGPAPQASLHSRVKIPAAEVVTREGFERGIARAREALERARTDESPTSPTPLEVTQ